MAVPGMDAIPGLPPSRWPELSLPVFVRWAHLALTCLGVAGPVGVTEGWSVLSKVGEYGFCPWFEGQDGLIRAVQGA